MVWAQDQPRGGGGGGSEGAGAGGPVEGQDGVGTQDDSGTRGVRSPVVAEPRVAVSHEARESAVGQAWVWIGVLMAVTVVAGLALMRYRKSVLGSASSAGGEGVLEMLRRARDRGEMTEEEFQAARRKLVSGMASRMKSGGKGEGG